MTALFPSIDSRRAKELYQELVAIAGVALPEWRDASDEGEFGDALLQIISRLSEHLTQRMDQTPIRDMAAFYRLLDIPADWARPAQVPLVFELSDNRDTELFAPGGVQVTANTETGEIIFETRTALKLTPAKLQFLAAVDTIEDEIETSPPNFLELSPPPGQQPDYRVVTFAGGNGEEDINKTLLQIEPIEGLNAGDQIRIDGIDDRVYRIAEVKDGLFTLLDPLEKPVAQGTAVEKVSQFDISRMRNLQQHTVYIGHKELLQLERRTTLKLAFEPKTVAAELHSDKYQWELYGVEAGKDKPDWNKLSVKEVTSKGIVVLEKDWEGSVEEININGESSRWLRLLRKTPITTETIAGTRTRAIRLGLETLNTDSAFSTSDTISQALYNNTPLPLTSNFLPFGAEPQRFDTFAIAAPEVLSKPGANVTLAVALVTAGLENITPAQAQASLSVNQPLRAYGVSQSGELVSLALTSTNVTWQLLDAPREDDKEFSIIPINTVSTDTSNTAGYASKYFPKQDADVQRSQVQALQLSHLTGLDMVAVQTLRGDYWLRLVPFSDNSLINQGQWFFVKPISEVTEPAKDLVIIGQAQSDDKAVFLLAIGSDTLYRLSAQVSLTDTNNIVLSSWQALTAADQPAFSVDSRVEQVKHYQWPRVPASLPADVVVVDKNGHLWIGGVDAFDTHVKWHNLKVGNNPIVVSKTIKHQALYTQDNTRLVIFAVDNLKNKPVVINVEVMSPNDLDNRVFITQEPIKQDSAPDAVTLDDNSTIQVFPRENQLLAAYFGDDGQGRAAIAIWTASGPKEEIIIPLDFQPSEPSSSFLAFTDTASPAIVLGGQKETLNQYSLPNTVAYEVFFGLVFDEGGAEFDDDFLIKPGLNQLVIFNKLTKHVITDTPTSGGNMQEVYQILPNGVCDDNGESCEIPDGIQGLPKDWLLFNKIGSFAKALLRSDTDKRNRFELAQDDTLTAANSNLQINKKHYIVSGAGTTILTIVGTQIDLPDEVIIKYRVLFVGQRLENELQSMVLDNRDTQTGEGDELETASERLQVAQKTGNQVILTLALPAGAGESMLIDYRIDSQGPVFIGERKTHNTLQLDDSDQSTTEDTELLINERSFVVIQIVNSIVTLALALPRADSIHYQLANGSTYTGRRLAYNRMERDADDTVTQVGSLWIIGDLQFLVTDIKGKEIQLAAGQFILPAGDIYYDLVKLLSFEGRKREPQKLELDLRDRFTVETGSLKINADRVNIVNTSAVKVVTLANGQQLPDNVPDEFSYDVIETTDQEAFNNTKEKHLYKLKWSEALGNQPKKIRQDTIKQLRYVPAGEPGKTFRQNVELASLEQVENNTFHWVFVDGDGQAADDENAERNIDLITAISQQWQSYNFPREYRNPELSWEYFNGKSWQRLDEDFDDQTAFFSQSGTIEFRVPNDLQPTELAGKDDYWIRARLVGGDYGRPVFNVETVIDKDDPTKSTQKIVIDTSGLNPPEIVRIEASFKLENNVPPQQLLVENNLNFRRQTQANLELSVEFELFEGVLKINQQAERRALYFGFNKPFNANPLSFYVDAEDQTLETGLNIDVLADNRQWIRQSVNDDTFGLNRRGFIQVSVGSELRRARLFGRELFWLRISPTDRAEHWAPRLKSIYVNAGRAQQASTLRQEILGSSLGEPNLSLTFSNTPVLPDSLELRVRETLSEEERDTLNAQVLAGSPLPVTQYPQLSLPGDWVLWQRVDSFIGREPQERVFRLDTQTGVVAFGNDRQGRIPPAGQDNIRVIVYQTGGGLQGNLPAFSITTLRSALEAVENVANPIAAAGGTAVAVLSQQLLGAPERLRSSGQALTAPDIEALAVASSPDLVRARALNPSAPAAPIQVAIALRTGERCPKVSLTVRTELAALIYDQAWGGLGDKELQVINPTYVLVTLRIRLFATTTEAAAALEQAATERLRLFFHPIEGGPTNRVDTTPGWPFGRTVYKSDVYRTLAGLPDLDRVAAVELVTKCGDDPALIHMPLTGLICADESDIAVSVEFAQEVSR